VRWAGGVLRVHVREHDRRAARHVREHLELGDELLERRVGLAERLCRRQSVEHHERRFLVGEHAPEQCEKPGELLLAENEIRTDVRDLRANRLRIEERHRRQVAEHARVRLCKQRHVDSSLLAGCHVCEARLVPDRGLAGARPPHDQVNAAGHEPTP